MKRTYFIIILTVLLLPLYVAAQTVVSIRINGTINPASADFIHRAIQQAADKKAEALLIHLNTPGGLLESTRNIVSDILQAKIPIIVYVAPQGSRAGSAGVFITMAAHIAVMAPGTNIGAAHPVGMGSAPDSVMSEKLTNDAAAFIRTIAEKRNRNLEWAEHAVRQSVSITETEALQNRVINLIVSNDRELLSKIDNTTVQVAAGSRTLHTKNAHIEVVEMHFAEKMLNILSDPNIAYVLMLLGFYGLLFELYNPGAIFPGIIGAICLILAFYAMQTLPVNYAGLALVLLGVILFLLEIKVVSHGMLTIGGVVSLVLGSIILFQDNLMGGVVRVSVSVIVTTATVSTLFFLFVIGAGLRAQRLKPISGIEGMIGEIGETINTLNPIGTIQIHGEVWNAESVSGVIGVQQKVRVTGIQNLKLYVETV
jgi:membrane-bound serine protease (ClpP class)